MDGSLSRPRFDGKPSSGFFLEDANAQIAPMTTIATMSQTHQAIPLLAACAPASDCARAKDNGRADAVAPHTAKTTELARMRHGIRDRTRLGIIALQIVEASIQ